MLQQIAVASRWLYGQAYLLLVVTTFLWAGNIVLGRLVAGHVPPIALASVRWGGAFLVLLPFAWPHLKRDWRAIVRHWPIMLVLSFTGIASYNTLVYFGLQYTGALTGVLLQSAQPLVIALVTFVLFAERLSARQAAGIVISLCGVVAIVSQGDIERLAAIRFNAGDILILVAVVLYAVYSALLRRRPPIHWISFLAATFLIGDAMLVPFLVWEMSTGYLLKLDWLTVAACLYVAIFPSLVAYAFFNRGVELIGANRAGPFFHLMPLFGALMAVGLLGERFQWFHGIGMAAILSGVALATTANGPRKNSAAA
ncbi:drug/metabolite transporter (DMT)-like permease [Tepidamorphus gemmatus]|jgi:drug/metabolite transporter (DMT)-like permease|uniref:Drug/metabolite transporter (DMT)-like permease n=1 Tax=Tepidamorphus gemmatus TaxID=747076 RepID=A0A4R3MD22_9HYPH|nr:DMT family transporter [Tepidamorphus gemmatus]TCT11441.1 drug/metabolite transporter (DMT)-like permease [Tepidamorphus gemmatus]